LDPITHTLFGACLSRTGFNRKTGLATLTMVGAAEFPDVDVFLNFFSRVQGFAHHRGFTHTFLGAPLMAGCVLAIVYGIYRFRSPRGWKPKLPPDWKLLYVYALIATLSHILLDFTNNYGVRPFAPFHYRWYAWDIVNIIEPLVTLPLLTALVAPWFVGLIIAEIGAKQGPFRGRNFAISALIFLVLVWWVRDYQHRRALTLMQAELYDDAEPIRVAANPYSLDPFRWHGVVETKDFFKTVDVDSLAGAVDPQEDGRVYPKPEETPVTLAAKQSRLGRIYLDWARFPITEVEQLDNGGYVVYLRDLRYAYPDIDRDILSMYVELDKDLNVIKQSTRGKLDRETGN
jgi:inner membrane protein